MNKKIEQGVLGFIAAAGVAFVVFFTVHGIVGTIKSFQESDIVRRGQDKHCSRQSDRELWKVDADCLYFFLEYRENK